MDLRDLRKEAVAFLDNGGGLAEEACDYCQGERDRSSSDNPDKAIISLKNDRETDYKVYISVQNELVAAYNQLRNREFTRLYPEENMSYVEADKKYSDPRTDKSVKEKLKENFAFSSLLPWIFSLTLTWLYLPPLAFALPPPCGCTCKP